MCILFLRKIKSYAQVNMAFEKNRSTLNAITERACHITNAIENKQNKPSVFFDLPKVYAIKSCYTKFNFMVFADWH